METLVNFQQPVEGLFVKLAVDAIRVAFPAIQDRWVHLLVLVLSTGVTAVLHHQSMEEFMASLITIFLAAIGANETLKRKGSKEGTGTTAEEPY